MCLKIYMKIKLTDIVYASFDDDFEGYDVE